MRYLERTKKEQTKIETDLKTKYESSVIKNLHTLIILLFTFILLLPMAGCSQKKNVSVSKPWTYWYWMGSSVTKKGITENLEAIQVAGIGGVHIIPIYGEKGDEQNFIKYLSPEWMKMLIYTKDEAERLGLGVDMTTGTGWPFGGPDVTIEDAAKFLLIRPVPPGEIQNIHDCLKAKEKGKLVSLAAYDDKGNYFNITSQVKADGTINLETDHSYNKIIALFQCPTRQEVKRAAPGGEGWVIDHLNSTSILNYMGRFEKAFNQAGIKKGKIRSFYCDSFEVRNPNWTNNFFSEFKKRRGYDLQPYIIFLADSDQDGEIR